MNVSNMIKCSNYDLLNHVDPPILQTNEFNKRHNSALHLFCCE